MANATKPPKVHGDLVTCSHFRQAIKEESSSESDSTEDEEKERRRDLEERDAFAARLRNKDKERTKKKSNKSSKKVGHVIEIDLAFKVTLFSTKPVKKQST